MYKTKFKEIIRYKSKRHLVRVQVKNWKTSSVEM